MITVTCNVPIYEHEEPSITISSHWNSKQNGWIEIEFDGHVFAVNAKDLKEAIDKVRRD